MVSKERLLELIRYSKNMNVAKILNNQIDDNLKKFDFEMFEEAYNITKNKQSYTKQDWVDLYEKHKDNFIMLYVILKNCGDAFVEHPKSIYSEIFENLKKENVPKGFGLPSVNIYDDIIRECLNQKLLLDELNLFFEIRTMDKLIATYCCELIYKSGKEIEISDENVKMLAYLSALNCQKEKNRKMEQINKKIENAKTSGHPLPKKDQVLDNSDLGILFKILSPVCCVKDVKYLENLFDSFETSNISDLIANAILCNPYIDPNDPTTQKLFDRVVDYCDVGIMTNCNSYVAPKISNIVYDTLVDFLDQDVNLKTYGFVEHPQTGMLLNPLILKNFIFNLIEKETIDNATLTDLVHRYLQVKKSQPDPQLVSVFSHISDPELIPLIDKIRSNTNKSEVYLKNQHIPSDMLIKRAEFNCSKIQECLNITDGYLDIKDIWFTEINSFAERTTLSDECYDTILDLLKVSNNSIAQTDLDNIKYILSLPTTPSYVLDNFIDFCNKYCDKKTSNADLKRIMAIAKINKLYQEGKIDDITSTAFTNAAVSGVFYLSKNTEVSNDPSWFLLENIKNIVTLYKTISKEKENTDESFEYKEKINSILNCFQEHIDNGYFKDQETVFIEKMLDIIKKNLNANKSLDEYCKTNECKLEKIAMEIKRSLDNHCIYTELPVVLDEFNKYYELCSPKLNTRKKGKVIKEKANQEIEI